MRNLYEKISLELYSMQKKKREQNIVAGRPMMQQQDWEL